MTLRTIILVSLASLTLTACGGSSDHDALVRAFVEADMQPETAECMADKADDKAAVSASSPSTHRRKG